MPPTAQVADRAHPANEPAHRCVLLSPTGQPGQPELERPTALLRGLRARAVEVVMAADAPAVMATLAERPVDILIVHGQIDGEETRQLLAAVRQFHPRVALWHYGTVAGGHASELRRVPQLRESPESPASNDADNAGAEESSRPWRGDDGAEAERQMPHDDEPLLSGEELRMLLGDDASDGEGYDDDRTAEDDAPSSRAWGDAT